VVEVHLDAPAVAPLEEQAELLQRHVEQVESNQLLLLVKIVELFHRPPVGLGI